MKIDLEEVPNGTVFKSDICVVGAGVAGLVLSTRLRKYGFMVNLIEAGGMTLEDRSQRLFDAPVSGRRYTGVTDARFRLFGGASTRWGGQMLPLSDEVFQRRDVVSGAGWPITRWDIESYYNEIQEVMGVNGLPFTNGLIEALGHKQPFDSPDIRLRYSKWAPFSKRNLARTLGRKCLSSEDTKVFLHGNAVAVSLDPKADHVKSIDVRNYSGAKFVFEASNFVLCTGTIETSRLLLASTSVCPEGIGNAHDNVGRYFHDHLSVPVASLWGTARKGVLDRLTPYYIGNTLHTPKLEASTKLQSRKGLLGVMAHIAITEPEDSGLGAARQLLRCMQRRELPADPARMLLGLPMGVQDLAGAWLSMKFGQRRYISTRAKVQLVIDTEQRPQADSRIQISPEVDCLGMRKAVVDWKISSDEERTVSIFAADLERIFKESGIHEIAWPRDLDAGLNGTFGKCHDTFHSMGGTRFGLFRRDSVVDPDLCVHGVENLFIASCSLFPSGGSSNPTFTLMALTLRLADHLHRQRAVAISTTNEPVKA